MKSIIYENSTFENDKILIGHLVDKIMFCSPRHKELCVDKILKRIQEIDWQEMYPNRAFIFCIYHAQQIKIGDIKTMLSCQAMDLMHHFLCIHESSPESGNFNLKFKKVFLFHYPEMQISEDAIELMRIIRNNVAHTGLIEGVRTKSKLKPLDNLKVQEFIKKFSFKDEHHALHAFSAEFDYLMEDVLLRVLGLGWDELGINLRPPSRSDYFIEKYV